MREVKSNWLKKNGEVYLKTNWLSVNENVIIFKIQCIVPATEKELGSFLRDL